MDPRLSRRELFSRVVGVPPLPPAIPFVHHLLSRATFGRNEAVAAELQQLGKSPWIERQLHPLTIDDPFEKELQFAIAPHAAAAADIRLLGRAIYSRRQLAWRMVHFLNNHFSTYRGATQGISETVEDDTFLANCFGTFAGVLRASATSPAMIDFLDSDTNIAGNPNENYARELLELHTLGLGGGYTESDVAAVARVFTGWSRRNLRAGGAGTPVTSSEFWFRQGNHDSGPKSLSLGWSTPGIAGPNGHLEGYSLLDFLAAHPSTATRFTDKLCRYFVADAPPLALVQQVRQTFVQTGGDLRATVFAIFQHPEFAAAVHVREKVMDGFEFAADLVRRLEIPAANLPPLNTAVGELGAQPHQNPVPTGYPEVGSAWQGVGRLLPRWKVVDDVVHNALARVRVPWTLLVQPLPSGGAAWVARFVDRLVDGDLPVATQTALAVFMDGRLASLPPQPTQAQLLPHVRDLVSLILRLPEAQLH